MHLRIIRQKMLRVDVLIGVGMLLFSIAAAMYYFEDIHHKHEIMRHAWQKRPSLPSAHRSKHGDWVAKEVMDEWIKIEKSRYAFVKPQMKQGAIDLLQQKSWIPLEHDQIAKWCALKIDTASVTTLKAYLVRGLSYELKPMMTNIFFKPGNRELWVQTVEYNGEIFFPCGGWFVHEVPVVALLDSPPNEVSVTAHWGGDDVTTAEVKKDTAFFLVDLDYPQETVKN